MKLFHSLKDRNNFLKLVLKILLALVVIQLLRTTIFGFLWWNVQPGGNISLFQILNGLSFIIVGIILILYFKPSLDDLALKWNNIRFKTRIIYILGFAVITMLILTQYTFEWELHVLIFALLFAIITPVFEELLFRGYIWGRISDSEGMVHP